MKTALLAATAVLALTAGGAFAGPLPGVVAKSTAHVTPIIGGGTVLYTQNSNLSTEALVSDNFTSGSFASYSDSGADDFVVPAGKKWVINGVDVSGLYSNCTQGVNCGPATSEVVTFYTSSKGLPGKVVSTQTVSCTDNAGSFTCKLPTPAKLSGGTKGKTYWLGFVANMNFSAAREWYWYLTSIHGKAAEWENPGGAFGVCQTWGTNQSCLGYSGDYAFDLRGKSK